MKYSRFWETRAGDRARSALRGVGRSRAPCFLRDEAAVAAACLERGRQPRRPYFIDSASGLSRKMGFPDSSASSICHSGCFSKSPATSRAMSANMPSASLRAAPSLGQSEATLRLERPSCRIPMSAMARRIEMSRRHARQYRTGEFQKGPLTKINRDHSPYKWMRYLSIIWLHQSERGRPRLPWRSQYP
jgi:hypothetical protein